MKKYLLPLFFIIACKQSIKIPVNNKQEIEVKTNKRKISSEELNLFNLMCEYYNSPKYGADKIINKYERPFEGIEEYLNDSLKFDNEGYLYYGTEENIFQRNYRLLNPPHPDVDNNNFTFTYSTGGAHGGYTYEIQHIGERWICIKKLDEYYNSGLEIWVNKEMVYSKIKTSELLE